MIAVLLLTWPRATGIVARSQEEDWRECGGSRDKSACVGGWWWFWWWVWFWFGLDFRAAAD